MSAPMQSLKQILTIADSFERDFPVDQRVIGSGSGVKAAGEIHTCKDVLKMIAAGANRIGAGEGVPIFNEALGATL